jgi:hypothetical protein
MGYLRLRGRGQLSLSGCDSRPVYPHLSTDDAEAVRRFVAPREARLRADHTSCSRWREHSTDATPYTRATPAGATCAAGREPGLSALDASTDPS